MWGRVSLYNLCAEQRKSQLAKSPWREPGTGSKWISSRGIYCQKRKGFLMKYLPLYLLPIRKGFLTKSIFLYLLPTKGKDYKSFPISIVYDRYLYCITKKGCLIVNCPIRHSLLFFIGSLHWLSRFPYQDNKEI